MTNKVSQNVVRLNFPQIDPDEILVAKYLKDSERLTSKSMKAIMSYWYSIALAEDPNSSEEEIRLALSESLIALNAQMMMLLEYHKITQQIEPSPNLIARLGITSGAISTQTPTASARSIIAIHPPLDVAPPSNQTQEVTVAVEDLEDNENDEDDEDEEPKFMTPQLVTDFSSFMSK